MQSQPMQVLTSHDSQDWFTPPEIIYLVKEVLGEIDLDPCGHPIAQEWIKAGSYWTEFGLESRWHDKVFCNPPYGKTNNQSNQGIWANKMALEYQEKHFSEGILLINSTHGYNWYEDLWTRFPVCLLRERLRFLYPWDKKARKGGQAKRGQTLVYFGSNVSKFEAVFKSIGRIILP